MAVLQMQRISICAMKKNRKAILEELQSLGVLEIDAAELDLELKTMDTMNARLIFEKNASLCDQAIEILDEFSKEKQSMLASLAGKPLIGRKQEEEAIRDQEEILRTAREIQGYRKKLTENSAAAVKLEQQEAALAPWLKLDIPMNFGGTAKAAVLVGSIDGNITLDQVYSQLAADAPQLEAFDIREISNDAGKLSLVVVCLKAQAQELEEALRMQGFARPAQLVSEVPAQELENLKNEVVRIQEESEQIREQIRALHDRKSSLQLLSDYFRIRAQKYEVLGQLRQSESTFFVTGYLPKKQVSAMEKRLTEKYDIVFEAEDAEGENVPVALQNGKFGAAGEGVLAAFGLPGKGEIDPSTIMTACYVFLFGLMLSDAAYGLIVFAVCLGVLLKFPRMESGMQKSIRLFMYCGLSTLFWGVMFGGYFGDFIDVFSKVYLHRPVTVKPVWFAPLDDPMKLLLFSLLFGLIHLFGGLALKGYMCLKKGDAKSFICDVLSWFMLITGLVLMLMPTELFASIAQMQFNFPGWLKNTSYGLAIVGAAIIVLMSGRDHKNPVLRLALGLYDIYNLTGWLSDLLSYSRLLALGLATGVIAQVINQMGSMAGDGIFGAIVFIIVFIVGHLFNLAINMLGAYVHTCRLQYVEFFGKFYEGGGNPFRPFRENTKYVDIVSGTETQK